MKMSLRTCPRCTGAVIDYDHMSDCPSCVNCGWRQVEISADVKTEYDSYFGIDRSPDYYAHRTIGTGKPPLSGWERVKRQRERTRSREARRSGPQSPHAERASA